MRRPLSRAARRSCLAGLGAALLAACLVSLACGPFSLSVGEVAKISASRLFPIERTWSDAAERVVLYIRLPRILLAGLVGASLAVCGSVLQSLFHNQLVSPYLLGISNGASFGAALVLVLAKAYSPALLHASALAWSLVAISSAVLIARVFGKFSRAIIILSGIIVSSLFAALLALLEYFADPEMLRMIFIWKNGSFSLADWAQVAAVAPAAVAGSILILLLGWRINALSMGDSQAAVLGMNPARLRLLLIGCVSLMTSAAVTVCGPIGWVGLVIPNLVRLVVGPDSMTVNPFSLVLGAIFLVLMDLVARTAWKAELPIGIITAIIGTVVFIIVLVSKWREEWRS